MQMAPAKGNMPDSFVLVRTVAGIHVLGSWAGGYTYGDSWRLSTPLKRVVEIDGDWIVIETRSGSTYVLPTHESIRRYTLNVTTSGVFNSFDRQAKEEGMLFELVPESELNDVFNQLEN